ncbi:hypothetical protein C8R43DRAFT_996615 [Mycena crocata]|nr:hypothetical protein C8R43DRAFT_996615 [Mycena crocata]
MKLSTSFITTAVLTSLLPTTHALVGLGWSMSKVPPNGLTDITFPITIVEADHISGYYFAQQYGFVGSGIGYTGIQPRPDDKPTSKAVLHGVFSSFVDGSKTTGDPNCHGGADGGPGVSCAFEWFGVYGRTYDFEVKSAGNQVWNGTAIDTVTGQRIHIGSYTLPAGAGGIKSSQVGPSSVPPRTTNVGSVGTENLAYEYGDCVGKVAFSTSKNASGVFNNCGFRGKTGQ